MRSGISAQGYDSIREYSVLLVDSETAVTATPWLHLNTREGDNWRRPSGAGVDQAHLMVQVMESWFLADRQTLFAYYGQRFLRNSLPRQQNIEKIDKEKVLETLRHASRHTQKGIYHKTRHGFELLELIDPSLCSSSFSSCRLSVRGIGEGDFALKTLPTQFSQLGSA